MSVFAFAFPSFSNPDIPISTTSVACDDSALNSDTGPVNIEIEWEPNEINLRWYNNYTLLTVDTTSNTCTYDAGLTPPTPPARTGYTFKGWRARPTYDFSTLTTSAGGQEKWGKGKVGNNDQCRYKLGSGSASIVPCTNPGFSELQRYEFKVRFTWGNIYGMSLCAAETCQDGSYHWDTSACAVWSGTNSQLESTSGQNCWCKVTGYKPENSDVLYAPSVAPRYVFGANYGSAGCFYGCPEYCMNIVAHYIKAREKFFGVN